MKAQEEDGGMGADDGMDDGMEDGSPGAAAEEMDEIVRNNEEMGDMDQ
jgi:hypothetical protein